MFGYFGSKKQKIAKYPVPKYGKIIEPFAGAAWYSLAYWDRDIVILDKYKVVVGIWKWLQQCSKEDILKLPRLKLGESVEDMNWDCEEAKWLVGLSIAGGAATPRKKPSKWKTIDRPNTQEFRLQFIAKNLYKIKHWDIREGDYFDIKNEAATWFIDPPYQVAGKGYKHGSKDIDYSSLASWSREREGQVIVCENTTGTWLPFTPLYKVHGVKYNSTECMYYQESGENVSKTGQLDLL